MIFTTPLDRFRKPLDRYVRANVVVLAGAGVSMLPPTALPSGDSLRDDCVRRLLSDDTSRRVVRQLLRTSSYRALLPEAVLQLMGSTVGSRLDLFMKQVLHAAVPNVVHNALVKRGYRIFTTNFDTCFEAAGGVHTRHLHGWVHVARDSSCNARIPDYEHGADFEIGIGDVSHGYVGLDRRSARRGRF